jgi:hypothetical protein
MGYVLAGIGGFVLGVIVVYVIAARGLSKMNW